jgi:hypothetical protein
MGLYSLLGRLWAVVLAWIVCVLCTINVFKHVDAYSYNSVDVKLVASLEQFMSLYFSPENETALGNIFVGVFQSHCLSTLLDCHPFLAAQLVATAGVKVIAIPAEEFPLTLEDGCVEIFYYQHGNSIVLPTAKTSNLDDPRSLLAWLRKVVIQRTNIENGLSVDVYVAMFAESLDEVIPAGTTRPFSCSAGIQIQFLTNPKDPGSIVGYTTISDPYILIDRNLAYRNCNISSQAQSLYDSTTMDELDILNALRISCNLQQMWINYYTKLTGQQRVSANYLHPKLLPRTSRSSLGFQMIHLPQPIFGQLLTWYREKLPFQLIEAYTGDTVNQREVLTYMAPLSELESYQLGFDLYPIMQDWYAGTDSLKFSNSYGFR